MLTVLAAIRMVFFALWLLVIVLIATPLWLLRRFSLLEALVHIFFAVACAIIGIHIKKEGEFSSERPLLVVTNHCSYLDIFVIAACLPVAFTPKREIASWPVIGQLCHLADCVFVERRPGKMREAQADMLKRIHRGKALCIFPEGTTNMGDAVKPFKSGFFSLTEPAEGRAALPLQPATIVYTHVNGEPIQTQEQRDQVAWHGDMTLMPHLWGFMKKLSCNVEVYAGPVLRHEEGVGRKELCQQTEQWIDGTLSRRNQQLIKGEAA